MAGSNLISSAYVDLALVPLSWEATSLEAAVAEANLSRPATSSQKR